MERSSRLSVDVNWEVNIPLRDGVCLRGTLYRPAAGTKAGPCIVTLTPYGADRYHPRGVYFATHGLAFLIVDVRGRGNSQGEFRPYLQEGEDGYDVVEWLAEQAYCDGQVAMWGGSYGGYAQWVAASRRPPHLVTIVPVASPYMGVDFPMRNNIVYPYVMQWIVFTGGRTSQEKTFADGEFWSELFATWFRSGDSFRGLDRWVGKPSEVFQTWVSHPEPDSFWDAYNPTAEQYECLAIPVLTITGSYDDDQPGALEHYRQHQRRCSPEGDRRHFLVIGPWDHQATTTPRTSIGGIVMGPESLVDLPKLHLEWYAWTLLGGPKPSFLKKAVAYYVMGRERWHYADALDDITLRLEQWFIDSGGQAAGVYHSGSLGLNVGVGGPDSYVYDPREIHAREVEAECRADGGSLVDQSVLSALSGNVLVYHSAPLEKDVEVSGFFRFSVWIAIDCLDTDFYVSVHEVGLDGSSIRLSTDALRARYREGLRQPQLVRTTEPLLYEFTRFTFVSRLLKRGHRLRLVIAPVGRLVESTFSQRNWNAGGVVAEESTEDGRAVVVRVFHDSSHPSALLVPIGSATGNLS
jgi:uncharacterized protein